MGTFNLNTQGKMPLVPGIRLHKLGSIYSRTRDLIKAGVLEYDKRPLWYDVYEAHPPINEPVYKENPGLDMHGLPDVVDDVREVFYPEDWARSVAYSKFRNEGVAEVNPSWDKNQVFKEAEEVAGSLLNKLFEKVDIDRKNFEEFKYKADESLNLESKQNNEDESLNLESKLINEDESKK